MAVTSVVKLSELEGAKRIDAEYYQPKYLRVEKRIKKFNNYSLGQLIYSFSSGRNLPQIPYNCKGVAFIRTQNVRPILIDDDGLTSVDPSIKTFDLLEEGDILFVRVGEGVGNSSIITPFWTKNTFSDNVIRVKIKKLNPYFVITYLNSKIGSIYLERVKKGSARSLISKENIGLIRIFESTKEIDEFCKSKILRAQEFIIKSESLYSQAESLLLSELDLQNFKPKEELFYEVSLSEASNVHRIDAEYFNPSYDEILKKVQQKTSLFLLKRIFDFRRGIFISPSFYSENKTERPYIRIKELSGKIGIDESKVVFIKDEYPEDELNKLQVNDLIIAIIGDTIGKVNRITNELAGGYCSNNTGRLRIKKEWQYKILPEYAEILFQSFVIQSQIEKKKAPTGQPKISDNEIKTILVPILPKQIQQKIAELVQKSHEARRKAKQLLEEAKKKVERILDYNL